MKSSIVAIPSPAAGKAGSDRNALTRATTGIGFKPEYNREALASQTKGLWFEVHTEDYIVEGGQRPQLLEGLRRAGHEISLHGAGTSLAGVVGPDPERLATLKRLIDCVEPMLVSERLTWSRLGGRCLPGILPVPRTNEVLARCATNVSRVQELLGRQILIENPAHYLNLSDHSWCETSFLSELCRRSGCGLLIDVTNTVVGAHNTGFAASEWLDAVPEDRIAEIQLGGHTLDLEGNLLIDSHDAPVSDMVWELYRRLIDRIGPRPTFIERDGNLPSFAELMRERAHAQDILAGDIALAA